MTCMLGKDAPLDVSIERMSSLIERLGFELEESNWLNPIPNVWSVHLKDKHCPVLFTNGKGVSREAALASALGEFIERLSSNYFFADYYFGKELAAGEFVHYPAEKWFPVVSDQFPKGLLDDATISHYNMDDELTAPMLIDANSGDRKRGICALPFIKQRDEQKVWIPVNIIENLYVSNGMAAGNSFYEARVQAISEIFERHIKNTIISSGISLPHIPDRIIDRYPHILASIKALREQGFVVYVLDASLGGKFPLVNVTLINPENGGCFASFGAHPKFEVAFQRALTEMLQGRTLEQLDQFPEPAFDIQLVADQHNLETHFIDSSGIVSWELLSAESDYTFTEWNTEGDTKAEFEHLCYLIHKVDMDIYIADYEHLGIYSCRVIVPGMSEIYPVEELVWNNNNSAIDLRERLLSLSALSVNELDELFEQLDSAAYDEQHLVSELIGVIPDKGSVYDGFRLAELKCLISLSLGNLELALDFNDWLMQFGQLKGERAKLHRCLNQLLQFTLSSENQLSSFDSILKDVYGLPLFERCKAMLKGRRIFEEFPVYGLGLEGFKMHQTVLQAYRRLQQIKV